MSARRGRLNWSNIEVHISDENINKQHHFNVNNSLSPNSIEEEQQSKPLTPVKRGWIPKKDVGEIQIEQYVGNFMLTTAEQTAIDKKYLKCSKPKESPKTTSISKPVRISNRLSTNRDTPISIRSTNLTVGQHLFDVFVCHVESFSCIYIMFGDDYNRATRLFHEMNTCNDFLRPATSVFEPKEKDLVALYHEKKWFRGQCLSTTDIGVNVLCIDSGAIINCSRHDLRRLPDSSECFELLYKTRYEAIVTKVESGNRPAIVLYYENENVNDRLLKTLKLI